MLELFFTFFKIGLFTFGGGYAMIPLVQQECVTHGWLDADTFISYIAICESTPGPIAINMATFVGFKQAKFLGAAAATIGIVLPSFLIILCLSAVLDAALEYEIVQNLFRGIRMAVPILILNAGFQMVKKMKKKTLLPCAIVVCSIAAMFFVNLFSVNFSSIAIMLIAGVVSLSVFLAAKGKGAKK